MLLILTKIPDWLNDHKEKKKRPHLRNLRIINVLLSPNQSRLFGCLISVGWQGGVRFVKRAAANGAINVKAASYCQTNARDGAWQQIEADTDLLPRGNVVVLCHQPLKAVTRGSTGSTLLSTTLTHTHTSCHHLHQSNFTGLGDNECPVYFDHYGFGPFTVTWAHSSPGWTG